jgi:hypothetical protein
MRYIAPAFIGLALLWAGASQPALAQSNPATGTSPGGDMQAPASAQPQGPAPDLVPQGVPGIGAPQLSTAPNVQKPETGDPTAQLFTAINNADYNSAQDAISRGADLNGQNSLGETPLAMSIALNRNSITFMLLSARNEDGDDSGPAGPAPATVAQTPLTAPGPKYYTSHTTATPSYRPSSAIPVNDPGTPDPSAGFLGFGPKN